MRFICSSALVTTLLVSLCPSAPARADAPQLELGAGASAPIAARDHERGTRYGLGLAGRVVVPRERLAFDAGVELGLLSVNTVWYQGDATWVRDARITRVRAMAGVRYALFLHEHVQLFARAALGLEVRVARYDELHDDAPNQLGQRDLSLAPVVEPSVGARFGGSAGYVGLQVALPLALHRRDAIRAFGSGDRSLTVDIAAALLVGISL